MTHELFPKRALHPWRDTLPSLPEGKGNFYYWGPNRTVDPVVLSGDTDIPSLLLIQRGDTGDWALPGGFIDPGEDAVVAGLRELEEETELVLDDTAPIEVYRGPVNDPRSTLHAWPETTALLWRIAHQKPVTGADDARQASWVPLDALPANLYGSHRELIEKAIVQYGSFQEKLAYFGDRCDISQPSGGHMGYDRHIVSLPDSTRGFIKRHRAERFTDPLREQHSREYLVKEADVYRQLSPQTPHIAQFHELVSDHTLILDAYDKRDGWHWRAPANQDLRAHYINDVLSALKDIEQISFENAGPVPPSDESFAREGWGNYGENRDSIMGLLAASNVVSASELHGGLDELYAQQQNFKPIPLTHFAHTDIRQSNLSWHPEQGVRIIDWSWASASSPGLDTTTFLIDLAKSGIDVSDYMSEFVPHHARTLIGFWLGRAILPSQHGTNVRQQQLASAIAAHQLLLSTRA